MTLPSYQMGKLRPRANKEKGQGLDPDLCSQPHDTCHTDMLKDKDMKPCRGLLGSQHESHAFF